MLVLSSPDPTALAAAVKDGKAVARDRRHEECEEKNYLSPFLPLDGRACGVQNTHFNYLREISCIAWEEKEYARLPSLMRHHLDFHFECSP